MNIKICQCLEGAKKSEGLTVVIDVFRAFSVECFLFFLGAKRIYPIGDYNICLDLKKENKDYVLIGERWGIKLDGFDCGNSPSQIYFGNDIKGKTILHSTSSGTQGIMAAIENMKNEINPVEEILTGSLVNAKAIARYIKLKNPDVVSLVCMGLGGVYPSNEDTLCAEYIEYLLKDDNINKIEDDFNINYKMWDLKNTTGDKFFDLKQKNDFPLPDFFMCLMPNVFDFILKVEYDEKMNMYYTNKCEINIKE